MFYTEERNKSIIKAAPANYVIAENIIRESGSYIARFGTRLLIVGGEKALASLGDEFHPSLERNKLVWSEYVFHGEVCDSKVKEIMGNAIESKAEALIGVGGGKALDIAKIAAYNLDLPIICIPTIAATCAAVTPMSVLYHENGIYKQDVFFTSNPDMVLVDPAIIAKAPVQYLKSGILDAVAKFYEGSASIKGSADIADIFDDCALMIARLLFERMNKYAEEAVVSAAESRVSDALTTVVHLNIYFAGMIQSLGVKAVRNGIAHSVHNGLTVLPESHKLLHGLKVGYGILLQLTVLNEQKDLFENALEFFKKIRFIPSFKELGLPYNAANVRTVAEKTYSDPMMRKIPFNYITVDMIIDAINRIENGSKADFSQS